MTRLDRMLPFVASAGVFALDRITKLAIRDRVRKGTNFSIVAVAEGARTVDDARAMAAAETRLRFSSGVKICTSVARTTTLTLSTAPHNAISPNASQNHTASGAARYRPKHFALTRPKKMVATPKMATHQSIVRPAFCSGGR